MITSETPVLAVNAISYLDGYRLELQFSDGLTREVDFGPFLKASSHPEIRKYLDAKHFATFRAFDSDLMWGDFDLIFPIDQLHDGIIQ